MILGENSYLTVDDVFETVFKCRCVKSRLFELNWNFNLKAMEARHDSDTAPGQKDILVD